MNYKVLGFEKKTPKNGGKEYFIATLISENGEENKGVTLWVDSLKEGDTLSGSIEEKQNGAYLNKLFKPDKKPFGGGRPAGGLPEAKAVRVEALKAAVEFGKGLQLKSKDILDLAERFEKYING